MLYKRVLTGLFLILVLGAALTHKSRVEAGAAPPEAIPWDSTFVVQVQGGDTVRAEWVHFITREKYKEVIWGQTKASKVDRFEDDLEAIKRALEAKKDE
jgi:hypothetical protein